MSMSSVDEAIECGDAGGKKMFGGLDAALFMRKERTFKVDAERSGASRLGQLRDFVGKAVQSAQCGIEWCGDGGGEVGAGSARCKKRAHGVERLRGRFHHVVTGGAVDVYVEECRDREWRRENRARVRRRATALFHGWLSSRSCRLQSGSADAGEGSFRPRDSLRSLPFAWQTIIAGARDGLLRL